MAEIQATRAGRITVQSWHTDWAVRIQVGPDPDSGIWLTRKKAEKLPGQIQAALVDRDAMDERQRRECRAAGCHHGDKS